MIWVNCNYLRHFHAACWQRVEDLGEEVQLHGSAEQDVLELAL